MKEKWCECEGHRSTDFCKLTDFYCRHFLPTAWTFQYTTLTEPEHDRALYITGKCDQCGGFMRSGVCISENAARGKLLWYVCLAMLNYRPYAGQDDDGLYRGGLSQRLEWYWRQDQQTKAKRIEQFVALFHPGADQMLAHEWAHKHMPARPIQRETSTEFFHAVINLVQSKGFWPLSSAFITCMPAHPTLYPEIALCHPDFSFCPALVTGNDGELRIECFLDGVLGRSMNHDFLAGIIQTAHADRDTSIIMGSLTGALLYYGEVYRKSNLDRYVPYNAVKLLGM